MKFQRENSKNVPQDVCILIVLNFRDRLTVKDDENDPISSVGSKGMYGSEMDPNDQVVSLEDVEKLAVEIRRERTYSCSDDKDSMVLVLETSMMICYGLLGLHKVHSFL